LVLADNSFLRNPADRNKEGALVTKEEMEQEGLRVKEELGEAEEADGYI